MDATTSTTSKPSNLQAYKDRVKKAAEAEGHELYEANERRWEVREKIKGYYEARATIRIRAGEIDCHGEEKKKYAPSDEEKAAIEAELPTLGLPNSIVASDAEFEDMRNKLRDLFREIPKGSGKWVTTAKFIAAYPIRGMSRKEIVTVHVRYENVSDGKKFFVFQTLYDVRGERTWRPMEPDLEFLPFWKPEKSRDKGSIMVHEGAGKAAFVDDLLNDPERREERELHPWAEELACYEHWGAVTGALAMQRCDYSELRREQIDGGSVVYVCDNDHKGKQASKAFSRCWGKRMGVIMFDKPFPPGWDLANPPPKDLFDEHGNVKLRLNDLIRSGTWATKIVGKKRQGSPMYELTGEFEEEWAHSVEPEMYINIQRPQLRYSNKNFINSVAEYAHNGANVIDLVKQVTATKAEALVYEPGLGTGFCHVDGLRRFNIHYAPRFQPYRKSQPPDLTPWTDFLAYLFPDPVHRREVIRWAATLLVKRGRKMKYGLLLVSDNIQGVGKTTFAQFIGMVLGWHNVSLPDENNIVGRFNGWAQVELAIVEEIYSGHSFVAYNKLKAVVSNEAIYVELKNIEQYKIKNHIHVIACSNSMKALRLDDADRRWFVPRVINRKRSPEDWRRLREWFDDEGPRKIYHWACQELERYSAVEASEEAPWSDAKEEMIDEQRQSQGVIDVAGALTFVKLLYEKYRMPEGSSERLEIENQLGTMATKLSTDHAHVVTLHDLARYQNAVIMFDSHGVEGMKRRSDRDRAEAHLEKPKTVDDVARRLGFFVGKERSRIHWERSFHGRVISLDEVLAQTPVEDLARAKVPVIDLRRLIDQLWPL